MDANREGSLLLVEDETKLRRLIVEFLQHEGFQVVEAGDGREGIERFHCDGPFGLVLLDLDLPVLPGIEVCRWIKQSQPDQPILVCSAAILDAHFLTLAQLNVDEFLSKPYHPAELLERIRRLRPCEHSSPLPKAWSSPDSDGSLDLRSPQTKGHILQGPHRPAANPVQETRHRV